MIPRTPDNELNALLVVSLLVFGESAVVGVFDEAILADLAALERGLGDAGTGEKIVLNGGPLS